MNIKQGGLPTEKILKDKGRLHLSKKKLFLQ